MNTLQVSESDLLGTSIALSHLDPDRSLSTAQLALCAFETSADLRGQVHALMQITRLFFDKGATHEGGEWLMKALTLSELHDLHPEHGQLLAETGSLHYTLGDYTEAIAYWTDCLDYANPLFSDEARLHAHVGIGQIYYALGDYPAALRHHRLSLDLAAPSNPHTTAKSLLNLAADYYQLEQLKQMEDCLTQAESLCRTANNLSYLGEVCYYRTLLALQLDDPVGAQRHAADAASLQHICSWSQISNAIAQAQMLRQRNEHPAALAMLSETLDQVEHSNCRHHLQLVFRLIATLHHETGNAAQRAVFLQRYQETSQQLVSDDVQGKLAELEEKLARYTRDSHH
ncbi:tetratricopeptide repeat protein [Chitinilyticum piscinae]|uniref:Tetratricopeptide repeat protein n=1 Tax=Chitinilyticum piscinae TaxID=2866724 RepID=A0A8J7K833_9NEIS|nr:tetratricopeptide repeat protein [Chitinilyticum piscinae]MBE9608968.1 tetratricopeptide repeat protein [Chitinilyticum piscinae]